jgi:uncharacterized protein
MIKYIPFFLLFLIPTLLVGQEAYQKEIKKYRKSHKFGLQQKFDGPLKPRDLKKLDYFPADKKWVVNAHVQLTPEADLLNLPTSAQSTKSYRMYANLEFTIDGEKLSIPVYQQAGMERHPELKDHLFLPFTDLTSGESTYGGGRYIDLSLSAISKGVILLDFNKAYNPYCAYADGWNCPIPPRENFIPLAIEAGEKEYTGKRRSR